MNKISESAANFHFFYSHKVWSSFLPRIFFKPKKYQGQKRYQVQYVTRRLHSAQPQFIDFCHKTPFNNLHYKRVIFNNLYHRNIKRRVGKHISAE